MHRMEDHDLTICRSYFRFDTKDLKDIGLALVNRVFNFWDKAYEPWHIQRISEAKNQRDIDAAETKLTVAGIAQRAGDRLASQEIRKQLNIETVVALAARELDKSHKPGSPDKLGDDFLHNFFDKMQSVSSDDMQSIWAKILAGEASRPGSFSRFTINTMASVDERAANAFVAICKYVLVVDGEAAPFFFGLPHCPDIIDEQLHALDDIGLIRRSGGGPYEFGNLPKKTLISYGARKVQLEFADTRPHSLVSGYTKFTIAGNEIYGVIGEKAHASSDDYWQFLVNDWKLQHGLTVTELGE